MDKKRKWVHITLGILQIFVGIGAIPVGIMLMLDPSGGITGFPADWLEGSIFPNYLIPGIFLFAVNGVCSLVGAYLTFKRHHLAGLGAIGLGLFLIAWIVIQVITLGLPIFWLQYLYFGLGAAELVLGWIMNPAVSRKLFNKG